MPDATRLPGLLASRRAPFKVADEGLAEKVCTLQYLRGAFTPNNP